MMHCHVCDEDIPLEEIVNHVRVLHPDAYPIAEHVEVQVQLGTAEFVKRIQRAEAWGPRHWRA